MRCPHCSTTLIDTAAMICPHCGGPLDPAKDEIRSIPWAAVVWLSLSYVTPFAAWAFMGLVPQGVALAGMILATACALALALRRDAKVLAALGLAGGFLAPLLMDTGSTAPALLYSSMLALDLIALGMALARGWPLLGKVAFAATWAVLASTYTPWPPGDPLTIRLGFLHGFLLLFIIWPMAEDLRGINTVRNRNAFLPIATGLMALGLAYPLVERNYGLPWCAALTLGYFALFLSAAATLWILDKKRFSFGQLLLCAGLFLALSFVIAFSID